MYLFSLFRVHHWSKNILLFIPLILSQNLEFNLFQETFYGFIVFSLIASCGYIINDLIDYNFDKNNSYRSSRLIASGKISFVKSLFIAISLFVTSILLSFLLLDTYVIILNISYLSLVILYSLLLKKIIIIDLIVLTMFFILRLIIGAQITFTVISSWLLFFSLFIFLFLAINKRIVEIQMIKTEGSKLTNNYNRGYQIEDLDLLKRLSTSSALISVFVLSIYFNFSQNFNYYDNIYKSFFICLSVLLWILRILFLTHRNKMNYDPILFSLKDKISWLIGLTIIVLFIFNF